MRKNLVVIAVMFSFAAAIIAAVAIVNGRAGTIKSGSRELLSVHVVSRHGARTPVDTYPNDPYVNETFYPIGWGRLTNEGKLSLYKLGEYLRDRYDQFLGRAYTSDVYQSYSTDSDRTIASVQLINAGLWKPEGEQKWEPTLNWQPVPVRYEPLDEDKLLLVRVPCPAYSLELERVNSSEPIQDLLKEHTTLFNYLERSSGKPIRNFDDIQDLYTTLQAEKSFNLSLPNWTLGYFPEKMYEPVAFSYKLRAFNAKLVRLKGGLLLGRIVDDMKSARNAKAKTRLRVYGGHDSTIANLLAALRHFEPPHVPDYAATVVVEFSTDNVKGSYFVDVYYRMSVDGELKKITVEGCEEESCPFETFLKAVDDYIPVNWEEECKVDDPNYVPPPPLGP